MKKGAVGRDGVGHNAAERIRRRARVFSEIEGHASCEEEACSHAAFVMKSVISCAARDTLDSTTVKTA